MSNKESQTLEKWIDADLAKSGLNRDDITIVPFEPQIKSLSTNNLTFFAQYAILHTHNLCEVKYGTSETKNLGNHR